MMHADIDIWCVCGNQWGFVVFDTDGKPEVRACPHCGEFVTAMVDVQYKQPSGVSTEGAAWASEVQP